MLTFVLLAAAIVLIQIGGAYLRYLPFRPYMEAADIRRLWQRLLLWSAAWLALNICLLSASMLQAGLYKLILFLGWVPYFLLSMTVIRRQALQHLFVLGMQCLWVFALHTLVGICENLMPELPCPIFYLHTALYLALFLLHLPLARRLFLRLLPSPRLFEGGRAHVSVALLPLAVFVGFSIPIADAQTLHSLRMQLSRLCIPVFFFFMYRAMGIATAQIDARRQEELAASLLHRQLENLEEYGRFLRESRRQAKRMRQNLREDYDRLDERLQAGDAKGAMALIRERERLLDTTKVQPFSPFPIVNAALSVYIERAKALGIPVRQRVCLPGRLAGGGPDRQQKPGALNHDLAVLLANLLENAIQASEQEPPGERAITIDIQHRGKACVMEIANRYSRPLALDADGLPCTRQQGHGLGMASLAAFLRKYGAYADVSQEDGWVRFSMYWEEDGGT